jgi:hypothetical protein
MRTQPHGVSENLDTLIARQQELAAKFARAGKQSKARAARSKLMVLLNQRDMSELLLISDKTMGNRVQQQS